MLVVTASTSLRENLKYGVYYDPITRNHNTAFKYMGLYFNKSIVAIGEVMHCVWADSLEDNIVIKNNVNPPEEVKKRISEIIKKTDYYDIRAGHKFYVVDRFYETNFVKTSSGSLRGKQYFKISDLPGVKMGMSANEMATIVNGKEWH
jgi:hypothetical protein